MSLKKFYTSTPHGNPFYCCNVSQAREFAHYLMDHVDIDVDAETLGEIVGFTEEITIYAVLCDWIYDQLGHEAGGNTPVELRSMLQDLLQEYRNKLHASDCHE